VSPGALGAVWYRFAVTWRRQRGGLVALVLIVGLAGGLSLGSMAAARRTAASFSNFLASTNPSDVTIVPAGGLQGYSRPLLDRIRQIPHVERVESYVGLQASLVRPGRATQRSLDSSVLMVGSVNGLLFNQDRFSVTSGRMADATRPNEVMVSQTAAAVLGLHLGQTLRVVFSPGASAGPERRLRLHIVGIGLLNREVVADDISRFPTYIVGTPALTRSLPGRDVAISYYGVQVQGGARNVAAVERRFTATERYYTDFLLASQTEAEAEQSIRPEALALGVFGGIAGLAALLVAIQAIARLLSGRDEEVLVLRALGADPTTTTLDGLIGLVGSIVAGSVLAVGVAVALSPLAPLGPARPVDPGTGFTADWTVLGLGVAVLVIVLFASAALIAFYGAPHRAERRRRFVVRHSATAEFMARSSLPVSAVAGTQFALERGRRSTAASTRWALLGTATAMAVVAATLTFGSSLQTLVSQPRLYGWNWDYAVQSSDGYGPVPNSAVESALSHNPAIAASSGVWFATMQLNGVEVPVLLARPGAPVAPPIVNGHGLAAPNQIVLGEATLAQLHEHVGGTISMRYTSQLPRRAIVLRIVGVATMPAIGVAEALHTSMAIGAIVPDDNGRVTEGLGSQAYPGCNGPNMLFLRVRAGVGARQGVAAAQRVVTAANQVLSNEPSNSTSNCGGNVATLLSVQHPAQIANYRSMGTTPVVLAGGLALGAVFALGLALTASVRRRRRDLALLKTIGFTRRQLAAAIAWQSSIAAVVGIVVGLPLGVVLGRWLWTLFAGEIGAVPAPTVPVGWLAVAGVAAVALANVVAAFPGRSAARTQTGVLLREE
jgi:ABC-type lipoprotein release transport system permease subunit